MSPCNGAYAPGGLASFPYRHSTGRTLIEWWYGEAALKTELINYVDMQRGVRSLHGNVTSFTISSFNRADAPWMMVCWSSLKKQMYVAMPRGVRSLHGDVASSLCRHSMGWSLLEWRCNETTVNNIFLILFLCCHAMQGSFLNDYEGTP